MFYTVQRTLHVKLLLQTKERAKIGVQCLTTVDSAPPQGLGRITEAGQLNGFGSATSDIPESTIRPTQLGPLVQLGQPGPAEQGSMSLRPGPSQRRRLVPKVN